MKLNKSKQNKMKHTHTPIVDRKISKVHRNHVDSLHTDLVIKIMDYMQGNYIKMVVFNTDFCIYTEKRSYDDYVMDSVLVSALDDEGDLYTEHGNISLNLCSVYELAYILDMLESEQYETDNE